MRRPTIEKLNYDMPKVSGGISLCGNSLRLLCFKKQNFSYASATLFDQELTFRFANWLITLYNKTIQFFISLVAARNSLPTAIIDAPSLISFKQLH